MAWIPWVTTPSCTPTISREHSLVDRCLGLSLITPKISSSLWNDCQAARTKYEDPSADTLQFRVDDRTAKEVMGSTLDRLFQAGRLFYADYRDQADLPKTSRYGAACDAYFYIEESSGDFLPLAIRTNVGANLIYTPEDSPSDWLLAKIMLNANDFWFAQWMHLAQTHEVVQIAYMAAIRTLSEQHPVLALLNRCKLHKIGLGGFTDTLSSVMFEVFAIQPLAQVRYAFHPQAKRMLTQS